ncbi:abortive infection protein [Oscillatoria amoena NRMC-F 0135]|nr:abortive infection protein [Geitlerinema splendidum]MDL5044878.1 abortive infection protein [Oscillatoria amoena NRMC-F 0135]
MSDFSSALPALDSLNPKSLYRPIGTWTGRLILPSANSRHPDGSVWIEIHNADPRYCDWVGKRVRLKWIQTPKIQAFLKRVTTDINYSHEVELSRQRGNRHPDRLNQWKKVSPLESLAGARTEDSVTVLLTDPRIETEPQLALAIASEPIQITGRYYALVQILQPETPGSDRYWVCHYNPTHQQFNGPKEIVRIPQVPPDARGVARSTPQGIEQSPLNSLGWYIYGDYNAQGLFTVQAIEPRAILRLVPDRTYTGLSACLNYITQENWRNTPDQKGTANTTLLAPFGHSPESALSQWTEGDTGIVIHLFGGIDGKKAEPKALWVTTGHLSYGVAKVVRCPLTDELRFDIDYWQVYGHNPDDIISGLVKWQSYTGDLERGWLGNRPISDIIVKFPAITEDYDFDGIILSPLQEFCDQLQTMTARYRTGDGDGASIVTPATSCVQDSNQALYLTIKRIESEIRSNPEIRQWLNQNPYSSQRWRFEQLASLGQSIERHLRPIGFLRSDWQPSAQELAGVGSLEYPGLVLVKALTSWRTILPRRAHDDIAKILLRHGSLQWVIRTNQVGGCDPEIQPRAASTLF